MKQIIVISAILSAFNLFSQDIKLISKVNKDSICIKWLPTNFDQLMIITKGAKISRIESQAISNFESLNFTVAKNWELRPLKDRYNEDNPSLRNEQIKILLEPLFTSNILPEQKNFAIGTIVIENVISRDFQFVLGNIIVDKEFDKEKSYVYKIQLDNYKSLFIAINAKSETDYSPIDKFSIKLDQRKTVDLLWDSKPISSQAFGFNIEHTLDTLSKLNSLTEKPYLPFKSSSEIVDKLELFRHESPVKGKMNYYRIIGIDPFGSPEIYSKWKGVYVPDLIDAFPVIDTIYAKKEERIVKASVQVKGKSTKIEKVVLYKSLKRDTLFVPVESQNYTAEKYDFTIKGLTSGDHFYYKIATLNKDDTVYSTPYYFFTLDQEPPSKPLGLNGKVDSLGVVSLTWERGAENDLKGYRVFRANSTKEEFVEKTNFLLKEVAFSDTLALDNLTSEVYYFIQVVDNNFNNSISSDTLLLLKPDTIAPSQPLISDIQLINNSLKINWLNSESSDLHQSHLIRFSGNNVDTLVDWKSKDLFAFLDSILIEGKHYKYKIVSFDKAGNSAISRDYDIFFEPGFRKPIKEFKATVDKKNNKILLTWNKPNDEIYSYQILRKKADGTFLHLKTITDSNQLLYEDKNISLNNLYFYSIKYINSQGIQSIPVNLNIIYQ